jgi:isopentenyl phosphate kinase
MIGNIVFLKLGGSLITDKNQPYTPRLDVLERLSQEIAEARAQDRSLRFILGHGSGSFGHVPASKYKTRLGVETAEEWIGFIEVWRQAVGLNRLVMHALENADLPAMAFSPSAMVITDQGKVAKWNLDPLQHALEKGLLPVIYGDVVFDLKLGGTILSTEDIFAHLARYFLPTRLLLAGIEPGVWEDFPGNTSIVPVITPRNLAQFEARLRGSVATDVTGGMADKVKQVMALIETYPGMTASIFSGEIPGNVRRVLLGETLGTEIHG